MPVIFCILQFCNLSILAEPDLLVLPSILLLLPFGSLCAGPGARGGSHLASMEQSRVGTIPTHGPYARLEPNNPAAARALATHPPRSNNSACSDMADTYHASVRATNSAAAPADVTTDLSATELTGIRVERVYRAESPTLLPTSRRDEAA